MTDGNDDRDSDPLRVLKFDLAPIQDFDPLLLLSGEDAIDAFVLSLASAYNDLKMFEWMNFMLHSYRPPNVDAITADAGQWNGMKVQAARWSMAVAHEILHAIASAKEKGVLDKAPVLRTLKEMPIEDVQRWKSLVKASHQGQAAGPLRAYLRDVRNYGVFHYSYSERLLRAYRAFFTVDPKSDHNGEAFVSIGPTMKETRFFFADAAAQRMYVGEADLQARFKETEKLLSELHHTIASFVWGYLKSRNRRKES